MSKFIDYEAICSDSSESESDMSESSADNLSDFIEDSALPEDDEVRPRNPYLNTIQTKRRFNYNFQFSSNLRKLWQKANHEITPRSTPPASQKHTKVKRLSRPTPKCSKYVKQAFIPMKTTSKDKMKNPKSVQKYLQNKK